MPKMLPEFKSYEEEIEFWATANTLEYIDEEEEVQVELDPALKKTMRPITIRFRETQIEALKAIADKYEMPYQTMVRGWVAERIRKELAEEPATKVKKA